VNKLLIFEKGIDFLIMILYNITVIKREKVIKMLEKNKEKQKRKERDTWVGYFPRVTKDKTKYSRKKKHKGKEEE
jgi:hypothetical protein